MKKSLAPKSNRSRRHARTPRLSRVLIIAAAVALCGLPLLTRMTRTVHAVGDVSLSTIGVPVTQNFDSLSSAPVDSTVTWTDGTTLPGWYAQFVATPTNPTTYRIGAGASNAGALYSFGVAGTNAVTERALGSVSSGTPGDIYFGVKLTNNTGTTITGLLISYNGEQWRDGGPTPAAFQKLDFQYQVASPGTITDANTPTTGWTDYDPLDFTGPKGTTTAAALDGNAAANRIAKSALMPTGNVANGQEIWLRWKDINDISNDHGLAVDDISITPFGGSIGMNGYRLTDIGSNTDDGGFAMLLQSDGKIVVGGYTTPTTNKDFCLVRYNYDGTPDTLFGASGKVITDFNGTSDRIWGLALQSDNKIVAVGETASAVPGTNDIAIARYNTNGTLDTTFGGTGKVTTDHGASANNMAYAVAIQGTNIVVAGTEQVSGNLDFMIARYTTLGVLDATFGTLGVTTLGFLGFNDVGRAVAIDSSSRIVVGGYSNGGSGDDFAIARFTSGGVLDTTFAGGSGMAAVDVSGTSDADQAFAMAIDSAQRIVLAGSTFNTGTGNKDFALVRYTNTGALDATFDLDGIVKTDFNNSPDVAQGIYINPSNNFVTVGGFSRYSTSSDDFAIARYNASGALDPTLDTDGKMTFRISNYDERIYGIAQEFDGKIVAAGWAFNKDATPVNRDFALARFSSSGAADSWDPTSLNQPDLLVTKTGPENPNSVVAGGSFTYTITVTNRGPVAATNVVLTDALPAAVTYVSHVASIGSSNESNGTVTNNIGMLNPNVTATLTINVTASNTPQLVANTATATLTETDLTPGNNSATEYTRIIGLIDMSFSPSTVTGGCQTPSSQGTVTLSGPAPTGGATVTLSSADPGTASAPPSVLVPAGQASATFPVFTNSVVSNKQVRFQADLGPTQFVRRINVNAGACSSAP